MQVFSEGGQWPGGLFDHPTIRNGDVREGPFDPALSAGAPQVLVRLRVRRVHRTISADPNLNLNT